MFEWFELVAKWGSRTSRTRKRHHTYINDLVFLPFVDLSGQAAVSQGILDDVLVGFSTGLLI